MVLQTENSNNDRLAFIDGLRGLAIFAVIYHHLFSRFTAPGYESFELGGFQLFPFTYLSNGWMGVNLFFFLSGFVLYLPYVMRKRTINNRQNLWEFYKRRAQRLMPLYYICLFISVVFFFKATAEPDFLKQMLLYLTVTFSFTLNEFFPKANWVLWSLGIEIWFSILFPLIVVGIRKLGMYPILFISIVLALLVRIYGIDPEFRGANPSLLINPVKDSIFARLDDFVVGMFCCYLCYSVAFSKLKNWHYWIMFISGICLYTIACVVWDLALLKKLDYGVVVYTNLLLSSGFCLVTLALFKSSKKIVRLIRIWPMRVMGMMCYSLYVWHGLLMIAVFAPRNWVFDVKGVVIFYLLLFFFCALSYRYIEFGHVKSTRKLFAISKRSDAEAKV